MKGGGKRGLSTPLSTPSGNREYTFICKLWHVYYTQRPVIDANTLRKNTFSDFSFPFAQFDLLS